MLVIDEDNRCIEGMTQFPVQFFGEGVESGHVILLLMSTCAVSVIEI